MHLLTEDGLKPQLQKSQKLNYPSQDVIVLTAKSMPPVIYTNFFWQEFLGGTPFQDVYRMVLEAGEEAEVEIKNVSFTVCFHRTRGVIMIHIRINF